MLLNSYVDHDVAVISTLLTFVTMFRKAHEENRKQAELDKKRAEKEAEAEKSKAQLASKNVLILDLYLWQLQPTSYIHRIYKIQNLLTGL